MSNGSGRFLEALSRPSVVAAVLLMLIAVNGFLLFRYLTISSEISSNPEALPGTVTQEITREVTEERTVEKTVLVPDAARPAKEVPEAEASEDRRLEAADLADRLRPCAEAENPERCLRDAVVRVAPGAEYVGGTTKLTASVPHGTERVLYFEYSGLEPCEVVRQDATAGASRYTAIVVGEGSFGAEADPNCIPEP